MSLEGCENRVQHERYMFPVGTRNQGCGAGEAGEPGDGLPNQYFVPPFWKIDFRDR